MRDKWARCRDTDLLVAYMDNQKFSQARLADFARCKRQFIHKLVHGQVRTCTPQVAERIEDALRVLPGTLFIFESKSPTKSTPIARKRTAA